MKQRQQPDLWPKPDYPNVLKVKERIWLKPIIIAGPCSIEDKAMLSQMAPILADLGVDYLRGGVYRGGTYPPDKIGLDMQKVAYFSKIAHDNGLLSIVEPLDHARVYDIYDYVDAFQVGARQMQNYAMLEAYSHLDKPIFLKRNMGANIDEFLGAAEYLLKGGATVFLIERGTSTNQIHVRWDLSVSMIPAIKKITNLPILIDASHGTGRSDLVLPMTKAGIAAGADGFLVEVHPNPKKSLSDGKQAYPLSGFPDFIGEVTRIWNAR